MTGAHKAEPGAEGEAVVRRWLEQVVLGLSLCPFAVGPHQRNAIRYATSRAGGEVAETLAEIWAEAARLLAEDGAEGAEPETTLLLLPEGFASFEDLLDLCAAAEALLERLGLEDQVQVVAFHPDFCFEGAAEGDPGNAVNRSPVPLVHLLRAADVSRAAEAHPDVEGIPERNAARLRALGLAAVRALWAPP